MISVPPLSKVAHAKNKAAANDTKSMMDFDKVGRLDKDQADRFSKVIVNPYILHEKEGVTDSDLVGSWVYITGSPKLNVFDGGGNFVEQKSSMLYVTFDFFKDGRFWNRVYNVYPSYACTFNIKEVKVGTYKLKGSTLELAIKAAKHTGVCGKGPWKTFDDKPQSIKYRITKADFTQFLPMPNAPPPQVMAKGISLQGECTGLHDCHARYIQLTGKSDKGYNLQRQ